MTIDTFKWQCPQCATVNIDEVDDELGPFITCTCGGCGRAFDQSLVAQPPHPQLREGMMSDEREICQCCEYPATNMEEAIYRNDGGAKVDYLFCAVCGNTFLHRAITRPRQYGNQHPLFASLGYIANMILDAIEKGNKAQQ